MVSVPIIQDSAQLETGTGRQRNQASPDAFGANEARATARVGQSFSTIAEVAGEKDDEFNEANALELDNELSRVTRERLYNAQSGFLSTQRGINAVNGRDQVQADLEEAAAQIATRARNPRAAALFQDVARRRLASAYGDIETHVATQAREYQNEQSEGVINEARDNAVAAYGDPAVVQANMSRAMGELERIRQREGWSPEFYQSRQRQLQSDFSMAVVAQLAETDPAAAEEFLTRITPSLSAQEAGQARTVLRAARREREDSAIDEAWTYVASGRRIPEDVWARVPGRSRIDIQNEQRRRIEGGSGGGDRALIEDLRVEAIANPERFATYDLRSVRGALGSSYDDLAIAQAQIRRGNPESSDVVAQRTTFNALRDVAETTLGVDLSTAENAPGRDRAVAFNAALLREVQQFQAANPGVVIDGETSQMIIGRAYVSMRGESVSAMQGRVRGDEGRSRRTRVTPQTEVNVPFDNIDPDVREQLRLGLRRRLGANPTRGEVENAYAAFLTRRPGESVDSVYSRIIIGGGE